MRQKNCLQNTTLILCLVLLCACTHQTRGSSSSVDRRQQQENQYLKKTITVTELEQYFEKWQGIRYRYGGLSQAGVDCSGFTLLTYRELFEFELPRTTKEQAKVGQKVPKKSLQAGDLVFFKPGFWQQHVGMYLDDDRFIHASSSKGVMVSSLNDEYWQGIYWQARRI